METFDKVSSSMIKDALFSELTYDDHRGQFFMNHSYMNKISWETFPMKNHFNWSLSFEHLLIGSFLHIFKIFLQGQYSFSDLVSLSQSYGVEIFIDRRIF